MNMISAEFSIKTDVFEGPLELLLELVEKRKLLINDISLAEVTDEYMKVVSDMQEQSLPNTSRFVALAATLLLLKSKSLLPVLQLTEEEEESIDNLEERLKLYQIYRDAAQAIQQRFGTTKMYEPQYAPPKNPLFVPDSFSSTAALREAIDRVLHQLPQKVAKPNVHVRQVISLEEMIARLEKRIQNQMRTSFFALRDEAPEHKDKIVSFLAILELVKQGGVLVAQEQRFADITVEQERARTPHYY